MPHAGGTYPAKAFSPALARILTFGSEWNSPLGDPLALMTQFVAEGPATMTRSGSQLGTK